MKNSTRLLLRKVIKTEYYNTNVHKACKPSLWFNNRRGSRLHNLLEPNNAKMVFADALLSQDDVCK